MNDGTGLAEALLGLPGFRVLEVIETEVELVVTMASLLTRARDLKKHVALQDRRRAHL